MTRQDLAKRLCANKHGMCFLNLGLLSLDLGLRLELVYGYYACREVGKEKGEAEGLCKTLRNLSQKDLTWQNFLILYDKLFLF